MENDLGSTPTPEAPSAPAAEPEVTAPVEQPGNDYTGASSPSERTKMLLQAQEMLTPETDATQSPEPEQLELDVEPAAPPPEAEAAPEETPPPEAEDPDVEIGEDGMAHVKQSRWGKVYPGYKWAKEATEALTGTDIASLDPSLLPPIEELKQGQEALLAQRQFEADLASPDPEAQNRVIGRLAANPQAAAAIVQRMVQSDQTIYNAAAEVAVNGFVNHLYSQARQVGGEKGEAMQRAAEFVEWYTSGAENGGRYRTQGQQPAQEDAPDPAVSGEWERIKQERAEIDRQKNEIRAQQTQASQAVVAERQAALRTTLDQKLEERIAKAIEPLKTLQSEWHHKATQGQMLRDATALMQKNANSWQLFQVDYAKAVQTGDPQAIESAQKRFEGMVAVAVGTLGPQALKEITPKIAEVNQARRDQLRQASSQTGPAATGGTPPVAGFKPDFSGASSPSERTRRLLQMTS